ncbi:MAG TPA: FtsQ-type POTRA domain-containing protein [Candidatus Dormibacteraeota bacterium]|nr:FtsQ-type POTRA domain-containing protein [Candidatus Dormibacteraeota bacterium]
MERVKPMRRNASAAAESDAYRPELLAEEEPRYLRRQKPMEIRRKKFAGRSWPFYRRVLGWSIAGAVGVTAAVIGTRFLLYSPQVLLLKSDQIELTGNHVVTRDAVLRHFVHDRNRSVLQIPLDLRRSELEQLPWVESANVQRILPNRIRVEVIERTPIAFLRSGNELALIDAHGVILDRSGGDDLHFPIVTGVPEELSRDQREKRMQTYQEFMKDVDLVRTGSSDRVSEIDLARTKDLRVVMTGLSGANDPQAVTIHFGSGDFTSKYRMLVDNFSQWQANAGRVQSIDLQYSRQVVVNSDANAGLTAAKTK